MSAPSQRRSGSSSCAAASECGRCCSQRLTSDATESAASRPACPPGPPPSFCRPTSWGTTDGRTATVCVRGGGLAGGDDAQLAALTSFAEPLGIAFQLRDDVISTLGDTGSTGKPRDSDLRRGKRTALVVEAMRDPEARDRLLRVLGHAEASDGDIGAAVASLRAAGAPAPVEKRIVALV